MCARSLSVLIRAVGHSEDQQHTSLSWLTAGMHTSLPLTITVMAYCRQAHFTVPHYPMCEAAPLQISSLTTRYGPYMLYYFRLTRIAKVAGVKAPEGPEAGGKGKSKKKGGQGHVPMQPVGCMGRCSY